MSINTKLTTLDMSGTTISAKLPTASPITTLEYGTPTSISIDSPTTLTAAGVKVDSSANIESIDLIEIPDNKTFSTFAKIMNL